MRRAKTQKRRNERDTKAHLGGDLEVEEQQDEGDRAQEAEAVLLGLT